MIDISIDIFSVEEYDKEMHSALCLIPLIILSTDVHARWTSVISENLGPKYYHRVIREREIFTSAKLEEAEEKGVLKYSFFAVAMVHATQKDAHWAMNQFENYDDLIPYVDKAEVDKKTQHITIEGGLLNYKLLSILKFTKNTRSQMNFTVIKGHFRGLRGKILIEPAEGSLGEQNTVIHFSGAMKGRDWPPSFVLTQGMKIALTVAARKMRSFIEDKAKEQSNSKGMKDVPQPKRFF